MIQMNAFAREDEELIRAELAAVERVIRSGWWILGTEVQAFESEWAAWSGIPHAVGVGNGMDALEIGLRALGIGSGDEVIAPVMTAFASVLAILRAGATPVFGDIDPKTAILSVESAARCIGPKTRAIMVVHLYGQAAPLADFQELCRANKIDFLEDCAQAHGACSQGKLVGSVGAFAGWSFYPTKNLGAIGDGGALSTTNAEIAEKARQLRNYGQSARYHHPLIGLNSRLDEVHAAVLRERLHRLNAWINRRREVARALAAGIENPRVGVLPLPIDPLQHVHHLFVVTSPKRDALAVHMKDQGVETLIHYPVPIHHQEPCRTFRRDPLGLEMSEKHATECLSLPCNPFLTDDEVTAVVAAVNSFQG
ncbi:MAG: DegT/DnrJ/EryC1/StrS family aminotransferase [Candidatus Ozemobacteraceae bacterium]